MRIKQLFDEDILCVKEINEGFSLDRKVIVNNRYVVRIISLERYEQFEEVYRVQQNFYYTALCQKPIKLIKDSENGYYITEYIEGSNGLDVIGEYSKETQYRLGVTAAQEIVKFHNEYPIATFNTKKHLDEYFKNKVSVALDENVVQLLPEIDEIIDVVRSNIHHLYHLHGVQCHADYHLFNMIFSNREYKGVIDFERVRKGIFLTDFRNNTPHNSKVSPSFASGYIDGYLDKVEVPDFFLLYNIYDLLVTIAAIPWVLTHDEKNIDKSIKIIRSIYQTKDKLEESPDWYIGKYGNNKGNII